MGGFLYRLGGVGGFLLVWWADFSLYPDGREGAVGELEAALENLESGSKREGDKGMESVSFSAAGGGEGIDWERLRSQGKAIAARILRGKGREDLAEDIVQIAMFKAIAAERRGSGWTGKRGAEFKTWFTRIVMNEALYLLRAETGKVPFYLEDLPVTFGMEGETNGWEEFFSSPRPGPEEILLGKERSWYLGEAIRKLSPSLRRALLASAMGETDSESVKKGMARKVATVKAARWRAKGVIRRELERAGSRGKKILDILTKGGLERKGQK